MLNTPLSPLQTLLIISLWRRLFFTSHPPKGLQEFNLCGGKKNPKEETAEACWESNRRLSIIKLLSSLGYQVGSSHHRCLRPWASLAGPSLTSNWMILSSIRALLPLSNAHKFSLTFNIPAKGSLFNFQTFRFPSVITALNKWPSLSFWLLQLQKRNYPKLFNRNSNTINEQSKRWRCWCLHLL